jgi:hypothetical protein
VLARRLRRKMRQRGLRNRRAPFLHKAWMRRIFMGCALHFIEFRGAVRIIHAGCEPFLLEEAHGYCVVNFELYVLFTVANALNISAHSTRAR